MFIANQTFEEWYSLDDYQKILKHRLKAAEHTHMNEKNYQQYGAIVWPRLNIVFLVLFLSVIMTSITFISAFVGDIEERTYDNK